MRLAYSCHDSIPSSDTNTQQIFWTLFEITSLGLAVDLFVPSIHPQARQHARQEIAAYYGAPGGALPSGFQLVPVGSRDPRGGIGKGWFDWGIPRRVARGRYDLVWTRDALAAASFVRRGLPTVFETYRPDFASSPKFRLWRRAVLGSRHLRGVITHSRFAAAAFVGAGLPAARCLVAHNGFAPSLMAPPLDTAAARRKIGLPLDEFLVIYTGHIGREKGIDALVHIAARAPDLRFVILGAETGAPESARIEHMAREAGVANLLMRPRVPVAEVSNYLYAGDCLIVPPTDEPLRLGRTVLPMKIFAYLAAGRPILAPRLPDVQEVLSDGVTACLVEPGDFDAAGAVLRSLKGNAAKRAELGENARRAAEQFTWASRARRLLTFLESVERQESSEIRGVIRSARRADSSG